MKTYMIMNKDFKILDELDEESENIPEEEDEKDHILNNRVISCKVHSYMKRKLKN